MNSKAKTALRHLNNLNNKKKVWLKSEIQAVIKLLNSTNYESGETKNFLESVEFFFGHDKLERKITNEQSDFGIEYLNRRYFKLNGKPRSSSPFSEAENSMIKDFSRFKWVGLHANYNSMGSSRWFTPIYRLYSKSGAYFDYTAMHWGIPEVLKVNTEGKKKVFHRQFETLINKEVK